MKTTVNPIVAARYHGESAPPCASAFSPPLRSTSRHGSGTYVGIHVLARALADSATQVDFETPHVTLPVYTAQRLLFNRGAAAQRGFRSHRRLRHGRLSHRRAQRHGSLKGVIADEARFERGFTRLTMSMQARCERLHVHRAARVLVTSRYSGETRAASSTDSRSSRRLCPELIDLAEWRRLLETHPPAPARFTVLFAGRFYRRKRVDVLLRGRRGCAAGFRDLEIRIVGNGPCAPMLRELSRDLKLDGTVTWLGDVSRAATGRRVQSLPTSSACRACRKASASCCWKLWLRVSRLSPRARRPFRKSRRTARWSSRTARRRWPPESLKVSRPKPARQCRPASLGRAVRCSSGGAACSWTLCAELPVGKRDRHDDLLRAGLARAGDHIGGSLLPRCGLDETAAGECADGLRVHGLRTR